MRTGGYHDSVTLLQISRSLSQRAGIESAMAAMATDLNRELLAGMGFPVPAEATPADLLLALRGAADAVAEAEGSFDALLAAASARARRAATSGEPRPPRTVGAAAARADPAATVALVSVPGEYAFAEALDALDAGVSPMVFSDNVPVDQEVTLKRIARERGLLVMGPDCGTAVIGGVGLGFANVVGRGPVGVVAASGTGAQQLMCLLDDAGVGVSHVLGVGGRDTSAEVGGLSTLAALHALDADPATELIVLVSKPADPRVARELADAAARMSTPVHRALLGSGDGDLAGAARRVLDALGRPVPSWPRWRPTAPPAPRPGGGALRGLFSGGTLRAEAAQCAAPLLGPIGSDLATGGHALADLGDDRFTRGRAHPMIDPRLRLDYLDRELADPDCAVVLLDVVLGHGAEADPAASLAPAIARGRAAAPGDPPAVIVSLCGSAGDPQDRDGTARALADVGAEVLACNADAARYAASLAAGAEPEGPADRPDRGHRAGQGDM